MCSSITRWDKWFSDENLAKDQRIQAAPPSQSSENAAQAFLVRGKKKILDLACGVGRDTFHLVNRGLDVTGVDASVNGLRVAQQTNVLKSLHATFIVADARSLPFKEGSFEGVYCFGLLHEFTGEGREKNADKVMGEVKRVMCDEGILALTVLSGEPSAGLPAVQLYTRQMFDEVAKALQEIEVKQVTDVGCTGRPDYNVWYGLYEK
jgi:ubiquinone/menaquinone biosynthesis C-methylase UbiE